MRVVHMEVKRFRGIRKLDWRIDSDFVCLIGPGDSTKSTILDAIELVLSPRWNPPFDDSDFYNGKTAGPIEITATITRFPEKLLKDSKFGFDVRGWDSKVGLKDEPDDECEPALSIRLRVDSSLEPVWHVINDRNPEGQRISARDRETLGGLRLGSFVDRHFNWNPGSALARLTGESENLAETLAEARRVARRTLNLYDASELQNAAKQAQRLGADIGVAPINEYRPQLDTKALSIGIGSLALHDGEIPLRRSGLGSRRLLTMALQREASKKGGVTLIDEIEHGLEPHRIRRVLRVLRKKSAERSEGELTELNQVFMTTHSPTVLCELTAPELVVVRSVNGETVTRDVDPGLQPIVRKTPEAFLGRKVLVCEGKTEIGLCRSLDTVWSHKGDSFAVLGVVLADGNGEESPSIATRIASLGYDVSFLGDSEKPLCPDPESMRKAGIRVFMWDGGVAIEQRIAFDMPWGGLIEVLQIAINEWGEESVRSKIAVSLQVDPNRININQSDISIDGYSRDDLRAAIGSAAKRSSKGSKAWFKRVDIAERLGLVVMKYFDSMNTNSDLFKKISALKKWVN